MASRQTDKLIETAQAYQRVFDCDEGSIVLDDLAKFAHVGASLFKTLDSGAVCPLQLARYAGQQEVYNRILKLLDTDISALHRKQMETSLDGEME